MTTQFCEELHWDLLSKKVDTIEGQVRRVEKDYEKVVNVLKGEVELKEKANEFQKELSRQQKQLKQEFINLSGRVDLLQNNESTIKALSAHHLHVHPLAENHFGVTAKDVEEMVQRRVQQEVAKAMEVAMQTFAKEHASQKAMSPHFNNTYTSFKKDNQNSTEELAKIKNEQFKLMGEIERLKSRQTYVEGVCRDIAPNAVKNIEATEHTKKGVDSLRKECDDLFHALSNSLSEMNMSVLTNKSQTSQLQSVVTALEAHAKHTEQVMSQFESKLTAFNQFKQESTEVVNKIHDQSEYLYAKVTIVENTLETHRLSIVNEVEKKVKATEQACRQDLETSLREITEDFNKAMSDMTDAYNKQHQLTLEAVEKLHGDFASSLTEKIDVTQAQMRDLDLNADSLSKMKAAIDSVLSEIDQRAQADASWSYNFNSLLQKSEIRLKALEDLVPLCQKNEEDLTSLQAAVEEQSKLLTDAADKTDSLFKDLETTLQNFREDIHKSLVSADEQNVQQFNLIDDMIVKIVNDIPVLIERAQNDTTEMSADKLTLLREEILQQMERSSHELYDTLLVAMETPLKEATDGLSSLLKSSIEGLIEKFDARLTTRVKEAMQEYQTKMDGPLLQEVEDRLASRLDESLEVMRGNTEVAMKAIASHLKKVENSVIEQQRQQLSQSYNQSSRLDDSNNASRVVAHSPSKRDTSTSTVEYPSISMNTSSSSEGGHTSGSDAMRVVHPTSSLPSAVATAGIGGIDRCGSPDSHSSEDSTPLQNVSRLVYQSPSRTKSTPTHAATASTTAASPMFGDLSELGTRAGSATHGSRSSGAAAAKSPQGYFIASHEAEYDTSHSMHTSSSSVSVGRGASTHTASGPGVMTSSAPAAALANPQLPPKVSVKSPPKSNMVFLTSTHYGSEHNVLDMSPDFSVSSVQSHHSTLVKPTHSPTVAAPYGNVSSSQHKALSLSVSTHSAVSSALITKSEFVQVPSPTSDSLGSPSDTENDSNSISRDHSSSGGSSPSTLLTGPHLLHESFADFNHIIDKVNTEIRALDLHLHDLHEGVTEGAAVITPGVVTVSSKAAPAATAAGGPTISPIKGKSRYPSASQEEEFFSDSTSEADDVLRASFLGDRSAHGRNGGKDDLDLTTMEVAQARKEREEEERRRAQYELYQKKVNHRKKFQRNLRGL